MAAAQAAPGRKLGVRHLVAATYFMVAGGPYGLEELVRGAGYPLAVLALLLTPLLWSLPVALMVSELSGAIPEDGGYYAWVKRALGPFWGFQEAWLSLVASLFDMAIYPTLFTLYLGRLWPAVADGTGATVAGLAMIAACAWWNVRGARSVGGSAVVMTVLLLAPFAALTVAGALHPSHAAPAPRAIDALGALMIAMWNYMGWDNASTIAGEVERPQRTYPLAMLVSVGLVALTYVVPVCAAWFAGIDPSSWTTGSWADAGGALAGPWLHAAIVAGGVICAVGMMNALVLSYTRIPPALAEDGFLPKAFARKHPATGAPWVSIVVCAAGWALCSRIGFTRLVSIDVMLYGLSLMLEFVALAVLRVREPGLARPFRVWGGIAGAWLIGLAPTALIVVALVKNAGESLLGVPALAFGAALILAGPAVYALARRRRAR